jgi:deazaflavin-dependent oxidoreductase (nitroreductase family)
MTVDGAMILEDQDAARSVCRLVTIGRRTGEPRELEIWFAAEGDRVYLLSGGRERAHWVRNLRADPRARLRMGGRTYDGQARLIEDRTDPDDRRARELLAAKYQGWTFGRPLSDWARESLPVVIDLSK